MRWSVAIACVGLVGCIIQHGTQGRDEAVIEAICHCQSPLPKQEELCIADLTKQIGQVDIPPACATCVLDNEDKCSTIETTCNQPCQMNNPPPPTGGGGTDGGGPK